MLQNGAASDNQKSNGDSEFHNNTGDSDIYKTLDNAENHHERSNDLERSSIVSNHEHQQETTVQPVFNKERKKKKRKSAEEIWGLSEADARAELSCWRKFQATCSRGSSEEGEEWFKGQNRKIGCLCLSDSSDAGILRKIRCLGLRRLNRFVITLNRGELERLDIKLLTWCSISLLNYFHHLQREKHGLFRRNFAKNRFMTASDVMRNAVSLMVPERQDDLIRFVVHYFRNQTNWQHVDFVTYFFQDLLPQVENPEWILSKLVKEVEINNRDECVDVSLRIAFSLSSILEHNTWDRYKRTVTLNNCLKAMLKIYLIANNTEPISVKLRTTIKSCLKFFIGSLTGEKDQIMVMDVIAKCLRDEYVAMEDKIELSDLLLLCSQRHNNHLLRESFTPDIIKYLLFGLEMNEPNLHTICHRILQQLLDRHKNKNTFLAGPIHFLRGRLHWEVKLSLVEGQDNSDEFVIFKKYAKQLYNGLINSFLLLNDRSHLIMCYSTVCLLLVEVPDPVVTVNMIHILVATQNVVLKDQENLDITNSSNLHATIAAIMTLICYLHDNEVTFLVKYVDAVIGFRSEHAPHLLPPLSVQVNPGRHHTTEYYQQLFFQEEEVLYALERCWLGRKNTVYSRIDS